MAYEVLGTVGLAFSYFFLGTNETVGEQWRTFFMYLGFVFGALAFGFMINDSSELLKIVGVVINGIVLIFVLAMSVVLKTYELYNQVK